MNKPQLGWYYYPAFRVYSNLMTKPPLWHRAFAFVFLGAEWKDGR